jgi:hypothetical protein
MIYEVYENTSYVKYMVALNFIAAVYEEINLGHGDCPKRT